MQCGTILSCLEEQTSSAAEGGNQPRTYEIICNLPQGGQYPQPQNNKNKSQGKGKFDAKNKPPHSTNFKKNSHKKRKGHKPQFW